MLDDAVHASTVIEEAGMDVAVLGMGTNGACAGRQAA